MPNALRADGDGWEQHSPDPEDPCGLRGRGQGRAGPELSLIHIWLNFRRAFKEAGFHISGVCIWVKNSLVLGHSPYQWPVSYTHLDVYKRQMDSLQSTR